LKKTLRCRSLIAAALALLAMPCVAAAQVKVVAGDVKDTRRTDGFFSKLEIDLKFSGGPLVGAKGFRALLTRAVDDTSKSLISDKKSDIDFSEIDSDDQVNKVGVELQNPTRKATTVKELSGTLEIFDPRKDPKAIVTLPNFQRGLGTPIVNPALKAAGIEITVWNKPIFDARKKAEEERLKKEVEAKTKKAGQTGSLSDAAEAIGQGLMGIFGSLMSSFATMEENDIALSITDPQSKIVSVEFEDTTGKKINRGGRTTIGGNPKTMIIGFEAKIPPTARLRLFVLTPGSVVKTPFKLADIQLP